MTASNSAEASDDADRPLTDEELGAELRRLLSVSVDNYAARIAAVGRRNQVDCELDDLHKEARQLEEQITALVHGERRADRVAFNLDVRR